MIDVMYDRSAWFLRVIMSSSHALCWFLSVKKQKHLFIRFSFCDIQNNQGLGKGYQPRPLTLADNPYRDLDYSGNHKNLIQ